MKDHNMTARIGQLHKTETDWDKLDTFVPFSGEIIVFDPDAYHEYQRIKIGDGKTLLKDLPFFIDSAISTFIRISNETIDAGRITKYTK